MHIFITGGSKGIGRGMVVEFLKRGHNVSYTGTSESSVSKSSSGLEGNFLGIVCDVRIMKSIETAKDSAISKFGLIDIWINNAGVGQPPKYFSALSEDDIREVIDVNVYGMILGTNVALKEMMEQKHGIVYNMEGLGSDGRIIPKTIVYASSKRFLRYFSNAANKELQGSKEVFVGTVSPGMVFTNLLMKDKTPEGIKMINILADSVEDVTPFIVEKMISGKKNINWLTRRKVIMKFIASVFKKKK
jgi:short-subunit dehydrogenase